MLQATATPHPAFGMIDDASSYEASRGSSRSLRPRASHTAANASDMAFTSGVTLLKKRGDRHGRCPTAVRPASATLRPGLASARGSASRVCGLRELAPNFLAEPTSGMCIIFPEGFR